MKFDVFFLILIFLKIVHEITLLKLTWIRNTCVTVTSDLDLDFLQHNSESLQCMMQSSIVDLIQDLISGSKSISGCTLYCSV